MPGIGWFADGPRPAKTLSVWDSVMAEEPHEALEAIIDRTAEKVGHELQLVEYNIEGPFSPVMRGFQPPYPLRGGVFDVNLVWVAEPRMIELKDATPEQIAESQRWPEGGM